MVMFKGDVLLLGPHSVDTVGKLLGLSKVGQLGLHPDGVTVGSIGNGSVHGTIAATLETVVTLTRSGRIPVEVDILTKDLTGNSPSLEVALAL